MLEVGLGGRLDSTNVCPPAVALITSISFDHTQQLGNRLASIATEKAGIIKPGRPVLSGATVAEARAVIERICRERGAPLRSSASISITSARPGRVSATYDARSRVRVATERRLAGAGSESAGRPSGGQRGRGRGLRRAAASGGLAICRTPPSPPAWPKCAGRRAWKSSAASRWSSSTAPTTSPRPGAGQDAAEHRSRRRVGCWSSPAAATRTWPACSACYRPHFSHAFLTRYTDNPRSVPPEQLAELLRDSSDLPATICPTPAEAYRAARAAAGPDDVICISGSVFLAGEMRPLLVGS